MDFHSLQSLRRTHPAWRLLAAENAPLIVSTLHRAFIQPNLRTLPRSELASQLEDHLFHLRAQLGEGAFPRTPSQYLDDWAADAQGWLRKYFPEGADEPHYDLTPATEKAIDWLGSLGKRQFIGTESRLLTVFELLRQLVAGTDVDPFGGGYALERLASIAWLASKPEYYWGDLDTHGFAILGRLRAHLPHVRSLLMDRETLLHHRAHWVHEAEEQRHLGRVDHLTQAEDEVLHGLANDTWGDRVRLEQERIGFGWVQEAVGPLVGEASGGS